MNKQKFQSMIDEFTVNQEELQQISAAFRRDIEMGLVDEQTSSLRMLKSYVGLPAGDEQGEFLALDFGGTNIRVLRIKLHGHGQFEILKKVAKPLRVQGIYDFIDAQAKAEDLFDFIAGLVDEAIDENHEQEFLLGHTFSFPSEQTNLYNAKLIIWTKEFATKGVEGQVVNDLLSEALVRNGVGNVRPTAVINDTVAVLLAAAYKQSSTYIGSIYATGHNTCYLEPYKGEAKARMIINLESGAFNKIAPNTYDKILDEQSEKPNEQRLEKMVSGRYLGVLFGLVIANGFGASNKSYDFTSIDLSAILSDETTALDDVKKIMEVKLERTILQEECEWVRALAEAIVVRSARLVAATFAGIIWHLDGDTVRKQHIAVDGSLYEKMPLCVESIQKALYDILGEQASALDTVLENGGSGLGAAIASAIEPVT
ncbi:hexokinase [Propionispira arboris]|uniref:Hexokinase n=1 Tax=Propionispira arboris TaxID=84035 RepID=A0A1H6U9W0_9FIRM|nr:hexokinase [Propionispira arboris]SEI89168.1 hexokinase [Propionispira arboris]